MYERGINGSFATTRPSNLEKRALDHNWDSKRAFGYRQNKQASSTGHQSRKDYVVAKKPCCLLQPTSIYATAGRLNAHLKAPHTQSSMG